MEGVRRIDCTQWSRESRKGENREDRVSEGGIRLQHENHIDDRMAGGSFGLSGLLARARTRTEKEQRYPASESTAPYVSAALGQTPYVAVGNGAIVVQRRGCSNWNC
jgi:hypothetical protein